MSIRLKCSSCEHPVKVADTAAGKVIKCPKCSGRIRVPGGKKASRKKPAAAKKSSDSSSFLQSFDIDRLEDDEVQLCQKCAAELPPGETECLECGYDPTLEVERARKKAKSAGPDRSEFFQTLFSDSFGFAASHFGKVISSFFILLIGVGLFLFSYDTSLWVVGGPPGFFSWMFVLVFGTLSIGWLWFVMLEVIRLTAAKKDVIKKLNFDFAQCSMDGLQSVAWVFVFGFPFMALGLGAGFFLSEETNRLPMAIGAVGGFLLTMIVGINSIPHFAMPITYRGWLINKAFESFGKTSKGSLLVYGLLLVLCLPAIGGLGAIAAVSGQQVASYHATRVNQGRVRAINYELDRPDNESTNKTKEEVPVVDQKVLIVPAAILSGVLLWTAFASLVFSRAMGLFVKHFRSDLGLVTKAAETVYVKKKSMEGASRSLRGSDIAPVGSRIGARLVDILLVNVVGVVLAFIAYMLMVTLGYDLTMDPVKIAGTIGVSAFALFIYFGVQQADVEQTTQGKKSMQLFVCNEQGKKMSMGHSFGRAFVDLLFGLLVFPVLADLIVLCAVPGGRSLRDRLVGTHVRKLKPLNIKEEGVID